MSSQTQASASSLGRKARVFILGILLMGLIGAVGLVFAGYRTRELTAAMNGYAPAASLYRVRTAAIHQLSDMETSFHRFLLDGNSASLNLMQRDKERIEQMAQEDPEL